MHSILVVEDLAIFREPIEASLRANGIDVRTATNGVEALLAIANSRPDLILLDLVMPVMDGLTTLRAIRSTAATRDIPVLVLSGENERHRVLEAVALGVSGYVLKTTFSLQTLFARIQATLGGPPHVSACIADINGPTVSSHAANEAESQGAGARSDGAAFEIAPRAVERSGLRDASSMEAGDHSRVADLMALEPLMQRSELLRRLNASDELQGFSPTVTHILKLTGARQCSMEEVAKAVAQDHAMSLKVLRLANSPIYSRGDTVDSVQKAVLRIGMNSIRQAVMNIAVVDRFTGTQAASDVSGPLLWEHSIACGIIASQLADALKLEYAHTAFTAGLLHDLGRLVFAERLGDDYIRVLKTAEQLRLPLEQVEARMLTLNHAQAMEHILPAWRFPKDLVAPVVLHHSSPTQIRIAAPSHVQEVLCIGLANRLSHALMLGSSGNETVYSTNEHCRVLNVSVETMLLIEQTARQRTEDMKFALLASSQNVAWPRRADAHRAALGVSFRPLFVSAMLQSDAYRVLCDQLADPSADDGPNLAVVHVASTKEAKTLGDRLTAAEAEAGVGRLPVLIISSGGDLTLPEEVMRGRVCERIASPFVIARFVSASSALLRAAATLRAA